MTNSNNISFDELDIKCISEFPVIIEILASSYNKIGNLFRQYIIILKKIIEEKLIDKKNWKIQKITEKEFWPLNSDEKRSLSSLDNYFHIWSKLRIENTIKKIIKNAVTIEIGHLYDSNDKNCNFFYFALYQEDEFLKKSGAINTLNFYRKIKNTDDNFDIIVKHPDENDEEELVEIRCAEIDLDKINKHFDFYKDKILMPFIQSLK